MGEPVARCVCVCVCVCVCAFACMCEIERLTERERDREREREILGAQLFLKYAHWQKDQIKNVNFLHISFIEGHYQSEKKHCHTKQNTATPSGNDAMKFSTEVSELHAAARVKGPEAAGIDNKVYIEAFKPFLSNLPWTQRIAFPLCSARRVATFSKLASYAKHACTLRFLARGSTLAN